MMKRSPILTAVAACVLLLASCKNKNNTGLSIPKEAAFVFHINTSSLASKLSWDEIKASGWFKDASAKADDSLAKKLMANPEASGIDLRKDLDFFAQRRGRGGFAVFEGSIKDAAAFETLCKQLSKVDKTEKSGGWNFLTTNDRGLVAWNDSKFAVIGDMPLGNINPMNRSYGESTSFPVDSLKVFVKEVMVADGSKSLFDDERFASLVKENGDMHMWVNAESIYSDMSGMLSMMKIGSLLSGNASASTINFDDGKITMKVKGYAGKEMQTLLKKWNAKNVEASVLNRIPSDNVVGVLAANIDPQSLMEFFKAAGFDGMANAELAKQNLSLEELLSATKGEFLIALSDLSMQTKMMMAPDGDSSAAVSIPQPSFSVLFATNVNQRPVFDKLVNTFTSQGQPVPFPYKVNNDWFVAGNKPETVDGFLANHSNKKEFADKISGHPFGMYIDFQRLLKTNFGGGGTGKEIQDASANFWKDLIATGGEYKDGATTAEVVVNLVDSKTNSLKQLNQYAEKMYQASQKWKVTYDAQTPPVDSSVTVPPAKAAP